MNKLLLLLVLLTSCTYNVSVIHTEGTATDLIDSNQKAESTLENTLPLI